MNSQPIDLRSDFLGRPTPEMVRAMNRAAAEPCAFDLRESRIQRRLEDLAAGLLGKEDALFFPTCTMCNQAAIHLFCGPGDLFIAESESHCLVSEGGAPAALTGATALPLRGQKGLMALDELARAIGPGDALRSPTRLIVLENTHNRAGGTVLTPAQMAAFHRLARPQGIPIHLDGARLFNAAASLGVPARRLCRDADSVAVSLNKGLSAPLGALLAGRKEFIAEALRVRQRFGGGWRPTEILAAAGIVALETMVARLTEDHTRARRLAEGIAGCRSVTVDLDSVQTNLVLAAVDHPVYDIAGFIAALARENIRVIRFGLATVRMALHWEITDKMIERTIAAFHKIDRCQGKPRRKPGRL